MRTSVVVFCMLMSCALQAQVFEVDTLLRNGRVSERINLVFMGDGYTATEQGKFITDVTEILDEMFSQSPFKEYKNYFNAYAVKVISVESGANHPKSTSDSDCTSPVAVVDNYFGSTFDYQGIHRLLYPTKLSKVISVLAANFPLYDQAFVAVNSPYYGGAGGFVATCSDHSNGRDVAIHEIGHSFAGLADEYWAGASFASEKPNMTRETNPAVVKWKNWMGVSGVGIYPHSGDASWKKPHANCKMGVLNAVFCKVCSETFVERFHQFVDPLIQFTPASRDFNIDPEFVQDLSFSLDLLPPDPNTLKVIWEKDNMLIARNTESVRISSNDFETSTVIRATVSDTSALTRSESHVVNHVYVVAWEITKRIITGDEVVSDVKRYNLTVYPNPAEADLKFSYTLTRAVKVHVSIVDTNGQQIATLINAPQENGTYEYVFERDKLNVIPAAYTIQFTFGKTTIPVKLIMR